MENEVSILTTLREAQRSAKNRKHEVEGAILDPREWMKLHDELAAEGRQVGADEASALELFVEEIKVTIEFVTGNERQLFRAAFIIRTQFGQVCPEFELCKHASCQASVGAWLTAEEALKIYR